MAPAAAGMPVERSGVADAALSHGTARPLHPLEMITGDFPGPANHRRGLDKMVSYDFVFKKGQS
jgi:hypothetical protein